MDRNGGVGGGGGGDDGGGSGILIVPLAANIWIAPLCSSSLERMNKYQQQQHQVQANVNNPAESLKEPKHQVTIATAT